MGWQSGKIHWLVGMVIVNLRCTPWKNLFWLLWHCTYVPDNQERSFAQEDSWCKYWQGDKDHKPSVNLPIAIKDVLVKTFVDLRADDLLSRCALATPNPNEAFNQIIWKKCPKSVFVTKKILEMGVASAVINHNDGLKGFSSSGPTLS